MTVPDSASRSNRGRRAMTKSFSFSFTFCRFRGGLGDDTSRSCSVFSLPSWSFLRTDTPERNSEVLLTSPSQVKLVETLLLEDGISWRCFLQTQQNPQALKVPPDTRQASSYRSISQSRITHIPTQGSNSKYTGSASGGHSGDRVPGQVRSH